MRRDESGEVCEALAGRAVAMVRAALGQDPGRVPWRAAVRRSVRQAFREGERRGYETRTLEERAGRLPDPAFADEAQRSLITALRTVGGTHGRSLAVLMTSMEPEDMRRVMEAASASLWASASASQDGPAWCGSCGHVHNQGPCERCPACAEVRRVRGRFPELGRGADGMTPAGDRMALLVYCPRCLAPPGESCRTGAAGLRRDPCPARRGEAASALRGGPLRCPRCRHRHDPEFQCELDCVPCGLEADARAQAEEDEKEGAVLQAVLMTSAQTGEGRIAGPGPAVSASQPPPPSWQRTEDPQGPDAEPVPGACKPCSFGRHGNCHGRARGFCLCPDASCQAARRAGEGGGG